MIERKMMKYACGFLLLLPFLLKISVTSVHAQEPIMMDEDDLGFDMTEDAFGNKLNEDSDVPNLSIQPITVSDTSEKTEQNEYVEPMTIDASRSLSQNLKKTPQQDTEPLIQTPKKENAQSWLKNLFKSNDSKSNSIQELLDENKKKTVKKRSNAAVFDIAGVMLRMSYQQAEEELSKRGYRKISQKMDIPNFIRWRNEEKCRGQGVFGYERLENCVIRLAQKENYQFISEATFNKYDAKETVKIYLSSTFTNNKIYKVTYQTETATYTGNSSKAVYLRNLKVYDFWKKINQKYGTPDNKQDVTWGLGGDKPYLKATTGFLLLEDKILQDLDANRMAREDQRFIHSDTYTF